MISTTAYVYISNRERERKKADMEQINRAERILSVNGTDRLDLCLSFLVTKW